MLVEAGADVGVGWVGLPHTGLAGERHARIVPAQVGVALLAANGVNVGDGVALVVLACLAPGDGGHALGHDAQRVAGAARLGLRHHGVEHIERALQLLAHALGPRAFAHGVELDLPVGVKDEPGAAPGFWGFVHQRAENLHAGNDPAHRAGRQQGGVDEADHAGGDANGITTADAHDQAEHR